MSPYPDIKDVNETMGSELNNSNLLIPFMGGNVVIKQGGEFTDPKTNKLVTYGPTVDVSSIVDSKGRIQPANYVSMLEAVNKHPEALKLLRTL